MFVRTSVPDHQNICYDLAGVRLAYWKTSRGVEDGFIGQEDLSRGMEFDQDRTAQSWPQPGGFPGDWRRRFYSGSNWREEGRDSEEVQQQ
ncbi:hypothetical protein CVT26_015238 [Gymnopilus dilepis]|uniref:Uncharacterized protein n=1 Tax=Gymnopilus dilepis TaxID=231916 RepID=A0A409W465_9AGAR|nr:hypothetical protein CVT26_015238 [Gymnopilus dilepis]